MLHGATRNILSWGKMLDDLITRNHDSSIPELKHLTIMISSQGTYDELFGNSTRRL